MWSFDICWPLWPVPRSTDWRNHHVTLKWLFNSIGCVKCMVFGATVDQTFAKQKCPWLFDPNWCVKVLPLALTFYVVRENNAHYFCSWHLSTGSCIWVSESGLVLMQGKVWYLQTLYIHFLPVHWIIIQIKNILESWAQRIASSSGSLSCILPHT